MSDLWLGDAWEGTRAEVCAVFQAATGLVRQEIGSGLACDCGLGGVDSRREECVNLHLSEITREDGLEEVVRLVREGHSHHERVARACGHCTDASAFNEVGRSRGRAGDCR